MILYWSADTTHEARKALAGRASRPAPLCRPSSPNVHAPTREGEGEGGLLQRHPTNRQGFWFQKP